MRQQKSRLLQTNLEIESNNKSLNYFSSTKTNSRFFMVFFAVFDIKYSILGTPFFEKNKQNFKVQDFTINFQHSVKDQLTIACFITLTWKNEKISLFCNQTKSKKPAYKTQHCTNVPLSTKKLRSFIAQNWKSETFLFWNASFSFVFKTALRFSLHGNLIEQFWSFVLCNK